MSLLLLFSGAGTAAPAVRPRAVLLIAASPSQPRRLEISENLTIAVRPVRLRVVFRVRGPLIVRRPDEPAFYE